MPVMIGGSRALEAKIQDHGAVVVVGKIDIPCVTGRSGPGIM